ncbi:MAG: hypothetical protein QXM16_03840 [Nitrososphaerota archaeon]
MALGGAVNPPAGRVTGEGRGVIISPRLLLRGWAEGWRSVGRQ